MSAETTGDRALRRVLLAARDKREQRGASGDGRIVVNRLEPEEALALDGLLSFSMPRRRPVLPEQTLRIALSQLEAALRACGIDPRQAYERVGERPLRDLPAQRAAQRRQRADFQAWLAEHELVRSRSALAAWLDEAARQGRVHAGMRSLLEQALHVVGMLPAPEPLQRTVLAARALAGDSHGLDVDTPLHGLTIALLRAAGGLAESVAAREVWAAWNVVVDPISSNVVALNLPAIGAGPVAELARACTGTHVVLTYAHLLASELTWPRHHPCFSCENPSVLIAAEQSLGTRCPPLICTGGRPSDAVRLLLAAVCASGVRIRHHGDFDEAGVQILRDLETRCGAVPWRFDADSLRAATARLGDGPVRAAPRPSPPASAANALEDAVRTLSRAVPEELLIDDLLADLAAVSAGSAA
ncbi:MAG: DUF2399 domain-containing protein [Solirubrobacteraceae bacterium]